MAQAMPGCMDSSSSSYCSNCTEHSQQMCQYLTLGCMDPRAINYVTAAEDDDGSCEYAPPSPPIGAGEEDGRGYLFSDATQYAAFGSLACLMAALIIAFTVCRKTREPPRNLPTREVHPNQVTSSTSGRPQASSLQMNTLNQSTTPPSGEALPTIVAVAKPEAPELNGKAAAGAYV